MILNKAQQEVVSDVMEALEKADKWRPVYIAVLKRTGDREQARKVLLYIKRMDEEFEKKAGN